MMALRINARLGGSASDIRREPTEYEKRLRGALRASRPGGVTFRRQAVTQLHIGGGLSPIGLVIDVDNALHDVEPDRARHNRDGVSTVILYRTRSLPERQKITHPAPSQPGQGL